MAREKIEDGGSPGAGCVVVAVAFLAVVCMVISAGRLAGDKEFGLRVDKLEIRVQALEACLQRANSHENAGGISVDRPLQAFSKEKP